ncbi:hypothetical protein [Paenibacillus xylanexedens]|uniref:hypothetical protein n=1 Tax=Paenibacillus xylanexedens TaxID=528191 RepID=UPI001C8DDB77|nr:hypothetical protein [Paenibacillus xylanexedens]
MKKLKATSFENYISRGVVFLYNNMATSNNKCRWFLLIIYILNGKIWIKIAVKVVTTIDKNNTEKRYGG